MCSNYIHQFFGANVHTTNILLYKRTDDPSEKLFQIWDMPKHLDSPNHGIYGIFPNTIIGSSTTPKTNIWVSHNIGSSPNIGSLQKHWLFPTHWNPNGSAPETRLTSCPFLYRNHGECKFVIALFTEYYTQPYTYHDANNHDTDIIQRIVPI